MKRLLALSIVLPVLAAGLVAIALAAGAWSPRSNPCALVTRADARRALGVQPRAGVAAPASDYAPPNAPKTTCAYFGAPKGYVRVTYVGDASSYEAFRKQLAGDVVDLHGIGDAALWVKSDAEIIHVLKRGFAFTVLLHYQSDNAALNDPKAPLPQLIQLAKIAASRI